MSALSIQPTYPIFTDIDGQPLEAGFVWIGQENLDPQVNPINVFWDSALTIPASQPIRTLGGYPANSGTPARLYVNSDYSIRVMNKNGSVVYSAQSATERYSDVVISSIDGSNVLLQQPFANAIERSAQSWYEDQVNIKDFGAVGDGITDDTDAIQSAFDEVPVGQQLYFPPGTYKVTCPTGADACLSLTRNVLLVGAGQRGVYIYGNGGTGTESILKVAIATADARGWQMSGMLVSHAPGSNLSAGLKISLMAATARITNCTFGGNYANNGYAVYIDDDAFSHSELSFCTIAQGVYANCGDANVFRKNLCFGERAAFTFNIGYGIRNNTVEENTLTNRDGWVIIENGDNIRIENNQCELGPFYTPASNQNTASAGIWLKGVDRPIANCVIRKNNFGGGTNYNNSVYIENAEKTVIDDNYFIACGVASAPQYADVYCDVNALHTYIGVNNQVLGFPVVSPRDNQFFKVRVQGGIGTFNSLQAGSSLNLQNSWDGGAYYKDASGTVRFSQPLTGLTAVPGSTIGTLPETFRPYFSTGVTQRVVSAVTDAGLGYVTIDSSGVIKVGSLPGVTGVYISDFQSKAIDVV